MPACCVKAWCLREANDWALEQEIQRLANLLSDQPEVNTPRQTDIARSLQKINQVLREGPGADETGQGR